MAVMTFSMRLTVLPSFAGLNISVDFLFQVLYMQALVLVLMAAKVVKRIFFGELRAAEVEVGRLL